MSVFALRSPSWAEDSWDALVAREVGRQGEIEAAFDGEHGQEEDK